MSRVTVTDDLVDGLDFARACVLDQRVSSHARRDHSWNKRYQKALDSIAMIVAAHRKAEKRKAATLR